MSVVTALTIAPEALKTAREEMDILVAKLTARVDAGELRTLALAMVDVNGKIITGAVTVIGEAEVLGALAHVQAVISYRSL